MQGALGGMSGRSRAPMSTMIRPAFLRSVTAAPISTRFSAPLSSSRTAA